MVSACVPLVIILMMGRNTDALRGLNDQTYLEVAEDPNRCAAVIAMCQRKCAMQGNIGTTYVQMAIVIMNSHTTCTTNRTKSGEIVPVNPSNENKNIVVFNVPCCQWQNLSCVPIHPNQSHTEGRYQPPSTPNPNPPTINEVPLRTGTSPPLFPKLPETSEDAVSRTANTYEVCAPIITVLLVFVILSFVAILLILLLVILKRARKMSNKGSVTINPDESIQTGGQTEGNIHVHNNGSALKNDESKRISNHVQLTHKDASVNETALRYSDLERSDNKPQIITTTSDYVVLKNQSFPAAPKSARPSRARQNQMTEEIIIVGAKNIADSPTLIPKSEAYNNSSGDDPENYRGTADSTKTFGGTDMYKPDNSLKNEPSMIRQGPFGTTGRLHSNGKLRTAAANDIYQGGDACRDRAKSDVNDLESSGNPDYDSIYNRLRSKREDESFSDYQRLQRLSQYRKNMDVSEDDPYVTNIPAESNSDASQRNFRAHGMVAPANYVDTDIIKSYKTPPTDPYMKYENHENSKQWNTSTPMNHEGKESEDL